MEEQRILAINPGSTSTKIAVYQGTKSIFLKNIYIKKFFVIGGLKKKKIIFFFFFFFKIF